MSCIGSNRAILVIFFASRFDSLHLLNCLGGKSLFRSDDKHSSILT